ncbi:A24 family peptidase [Citrobacter amalonaticus]|uniref:prepilin peptidase n=1 Tax=Citrobacter TaxID=544 RepID=UPI0015E99348|nr:MULTISPECIES: A24 family peptidase [Citrobacter]MDT7068750.1 A24 family peptidase [Citrobacter amalonaticus]QMD60641.1 prepilin peptidase [Citrobacter sp. RHB35-C17]HCW3113955.1 prepilin peptidase [Citrobacter amalonaticus]HEM7864820.1 prepilin peptidase [Citrobacter amalonaticus]
MSAALPFLLLYTALSLTLSFCDMRSRRLPDRFTCPLLWGGFIFHLCIIPTQLADAVWGAVAGYASFAFIYWSYWLLRKREGLGYGDVKFLAALGAWHGWIFLPSLVFWAALLGCFGIVVVGIVHGKSALKNPLPFGPFLAAAGFITGYCRLTSGAISWSL